MDDTGPKYPAVIVPLIGLDGNAFGILGRVQRSLRLAGVEQSEIAVYLDEAMNGNYDNLLRVTMAWVPVI